MPYVTQGMLGLLLPQRAELRVGLIAGLENARARSESLRKAS